MFWKIVTVAAMVIINLNKCEWIEIPQASSTTYLDKNSFTRKPDITSYFLTTTSTTTQTPVSVKLITATSIKPKITQHNEFKTDHSLTKVRNNISRASLEHDKLGKLITSSTLGPLNSAVVTAAAAAAAAADDDDDEMDSSEGDKSDAQEQESDGNPSENVIGEEEEEAEEEEYEDSTEDNDGTEENGFSYSSFIPFLSKIQKTLMEHTRKTKMSKVNVLSNLRDHLLIDIKSRISSIWGLNKDSDRERSAREHKDDHIDFPSNEGALLTIGFLTFAVFLIKLVLHLIHNLGNKINNNNNNNNGNISAYAGRKRREILEDVDVKVLSYIEEYPYK